MTLTVGEQRAATNSLGTEGPQPAASPCVGKTVVMLVTNEGLNDPRVLRSIRTASRAGYAVRLVCRALSPEKESEQEMAPPGTEVQRVPSLRARRLMGKLFSRRRGPAGSGSAVPGSPNRATARRVPRGERVWLRPWELWILGGMTWFNWQVVRRMRRLPADLYHANDLDTLPAAVLLSRWNRVPLLYDAHELFSVQFPDASRQFRAILFALEHRLIRHAHKVVTVNRSIAETLADWHRVSLPTVVMNCPVAPTAARPAPADVEERRGQKARVIFQGVYARDRGIEELILSAAGYESAELYLRGYGELEPALREIVQVNGLEKRVHFLPPAHHAHLVESLAGFDVGVIPYRPTTVNNRLCLPNKAFEYLQAGLALAVSALPELARLVEETGAGMLFDPDRPDDIARAINGLTADASRLTACKARARAAGARFTWEAQGEPPLLACYQELIGVPSGGQGGVR